MPPLPLGAELAMLNQVHQSPAYNRTSRNSISSSFALYREEYVYDCVPLPAFFKPNCTTQSIMHLRAHNAVYSGIEYKKTK